MTSRRSWTEDEVRALGVRCTVPQAGEILAGLSETQSYELHKRGGFPVPVLQVGRRLVVPVRPVLELLGLAPTGPGDREPGPGQGASSGSDQAGRAPSGGGAVRQLRAAGGGDGTA